MRPRGTPSKGYFRFCSLVFALLVAGCAEGGTTAGSVLALFAGDMRGGGTADGTGAAACFNFPLGVATDSRGNVYVADTHNQTIRKITAAGVVTTLAGSAGLKGSTDGTGRPPRFNVHRESAPEAPAMCMGPTTTNTPSPKQHPPRLSPRPPGTPAS